MGGRVHIQIFYRGILQGSFTGESCRGVLPEIFTGEFYGGLLPEGGIDFCFS